jgi:hypothetical protein
LCDIKKLALPVVNCGFIYKSLCSAMLQIAFMNVILKITGTDPICHSQLLKNVLKT